MLGSTFILGLQCAAVVAFAPSNMVQRGHHTARFSEPGVVTEFEMPPPPPPTAAEMDEILFALGVNVAGQLADIKQLFDAEEMPKILEGITAVMTSSESSEALRGKLEAVAPQLNDMLQQRMAAKVEKGKQEGLTALDDAAAEEGAERTASGLVIKTLKAGVGPSPTVASTVQVHYHGTLVDGTVFDSSKNRGEPAQFPLNGVIKGWTEGLQKMQEGGSAKFTIPADLAYGDAGQGPIPGGATLTFEVELLKVLSGGVGGLIL